MWTFYFFAFQRITTETKEIVLLCFTVVIMQRILPLKYISQIVVLQFPGKRPNIFLIRHWRHLLCTVKIYSMLLLIICYVYHWWCVQQQIYLKGKRSNLVQNYWLETRATFAGYSNYSHWITSWVILKVSIIFIFVPFNDFGRYSALVIVVNNSFLKFKDISNLPSYTYRSICGMFWYRLLSQAKLCCIRTLP